MNKRKVLFLSLVLLLNTALTIQLTAQNSSNKEKKDVRQVPFKSGYIKYELTGSVKGTREVWWDNYGEQRKEIDKSTSSVTIFGMKNEEENHTLVIYDKNVRYKVDYIKDIAEKTTEVYHNDMVDKKTQEEREKAADDVFKSLGGKKEGTQKVLGYQCDVISLLGSKMWTYKGVPLKIEARLLGIESNTKATVFKTNISISKNTFNPPTDVEFTEIENDEYEEPSAKTITRNVVEKKEEPIEEIEEEVVEENYEEYPYDKFKKDMKAFKYGSYHKITTINVDGTYTATFIKGFSKKTLTIVAASRKNPKYEKIKKLAKEFDYEGKNYLYYHTPKSSSIIIDTHKYDTYIVVTTNPRQPKSSMVKIINKLPY